MTPKHNNTLRIRLLGNMEVETGSGVSLIFPTQKSSAIFAVLVLNRGRNLLRESIIEHYWAGIALDKARKCLRTEIWRIRHALECAGIDEKCFLITKKNEVTFIKESEYELDVEVFENKLAVLMKSSPDKYSSYEYQLCLDCLSVYRGDLLELMANDWSLLQREILHSQYLMILEFLLRYHQHHEEWDDAISYAQRLLSHDPLLEHVHLALMQYYYKKGNRSAAISQYFSCCKSLREELGISPMVETEIFYREITSSSNINHKKLFSSIADKNNIPKSMLADVDKALADLRNAEDLLIELSKKIYQSEIRN